MSDPRVAPRRHRRLRRAVFAAAEGLARGMGGRWLYARRWLGPGRLRLRQERIEVQGLPPVLHGLRVAQLSDLHAGPFLGRGGLRHAVDAVNRAQPDLVALTGDFCAHGPEQALDVLEDLGRLEARSGVFAVFGNHDYRDRREGEIAAAYAEHGILFLRNAGVRPEREGRPLPLVCTGLEDLEEGRVVDLAAARKELRPGDVEIMLCHNPRGARALARSGCPLVLSGHTHGTQIDLPWLRGLGPDHPGLRVELGPTTLLVSRGLGVVGVPLRYAVPAEVVLAELVPVPRR